MIGGFLMGVASCLLWGLATFLLVVWMFSGFYSFMALVFAVVFFAAAAFCGYVSRQTVRVKR